MIHQVPLLPVCRVTIDAIELLNVIVYILSVSLQCSSPCKQFATDVTREVSLSIMNNVDVALKRFIVLINIPTDMTRVGRLLLFLFLLTRSALVMLQIVFVLVGLSTIFTLVLDPSVFPLMSVH